MANIPVGFNPFSFADKLVQNATASSVLDKLASKLEDTKPVSLKNGVLTFNREGDYAFEFLPNGKVKVLFDGGATTVLTKAEWESVKTFNLAKPETDLKVDASVLAGKTIQGTGDLEISGLSFKQADAAGGFEPSVNLDSAIGSMLSSRGVAATIESLSVNGDTAGAFKLVWDHLDDAYVAGNNYYNLSLNEIGVRLGLEYAKYLKSGGEPIFVAAKYAADGGDAGTAPDRMQYMHDNLLGNLEPASIADKFSGNPALRDQLTELVDQSGFGDRPRYDGNEASTAAHDAVRAWDYDRGYERPDYIETSFGKPDGLATKDTNGDGTDDSMLYGTGNPIGNFNIVRHEGAGVELALKAKEFGPNGGDYAAGNISVDAEGVTHYKVSTEASPGRADRADWSLDYAATVLPAGTDEPFTFKLLIDTDETTGVNLVEIPSTIYSGQVQGSSNYGFGDIRNQIDIDPDTAGVQPYAFGAGEFDIVLQAFDGEKMIAQNKIVVDVIA